jgi:hypothetical protein
VDISPLAEFVANVKCTVLSGPELKALEAWASELPYAIHTRSSSHRFHDYGELGYYKHLTHPTRWRLRKAIEQALGSAISLGSPRLERFGRCVVLRTAQWALDGGRKSTGVDEFRVVLRSFAKEMLQGARDLRAAVAANGRYPLIVLNRAAALRANETTVLRHINEDHVVPELQFLERLSGLMIAALSRAMDGECRLSSCSGLNSRRLDKRERSDNSFKQGQDRVDVRQASRVRVLRQHTIRVSPTHLFRHALYHPPSWIAS